MPKQQSVSLNGEDERLHPHLGDSSYINKSHNQRRKATRLVVKTPQRVVHLATNNPIPNPVGILENPSPSDSCMTKHTPPAPAVKASRESSGVLKLQISLDMMHAALSIVPMSANGRAVDVVPISTPLATAVTGNDYSVEYMAKLRNLIHPKVDLEVNGFVTQPLSKNAINRKRKCQRCNKAIQKGKQLDGEVEANQDQKQEDTRNSCDQSGMPTAGTITSLVNAKIQEEDTIARIELKTAVRVDGPSSSGHATHRSTSKSTFMQNPVPKPVIRCRFHDGGIRYGPNNQKTWSCCRQHISSDPCKAAENHVARNYQEGVLENAWQFFATPLSTTFSTFRHAVAIDCEMGMAKSGDSELIRITVIDYFSSVVLIDSLVFPDVAMEHYNTRYSGVTRGQMDAARRQGLCFMGKRQAREAVWRYVGPETILVGHAVYNDLNALRMIHTTVIDTMLVEAIPARAAAKTARKKAEKEAKAKAEAERKIAANPNTDGSSTTNGDKGAGNAESAVVESRKEDQRLKPNQPKRPPGPGPLALKTLTKSRLGRDIQTGGKKGHDSLEDAIASRDLVHWLVVNRGTSQVSNASGLS